MATILDQYRGYRKSTYEQIEKGQFHTDQLLVLQELQYRIHVLEMCMNFCKTAPVTQDQRDLGFHYRVVDAFVSCMMLERRFGMPADENGKIQRDTAFQNFQSIVVSFRRAFQCFYPTTDDSYRVRMCKMINTILPAWIQYRNTYTKI